MMTRSLLALSLAGLSLTGLTATGAQAQEATFVMTARLVGAPTYNPTKATKLNTATTLIFDRLVVQDADQSFHGQLASSWEASPDGMQWTFKLKPGVKFHNGEPFNARTIEWWVPQFKGTENAFTVEAIERVEVVDDLTVRFHMKHPDPNLLFNLATSFMCIPEPKSYTALGDKFGVTEAIGTGPYKMQQFSVGQQTVLVRNDDYAWASDLSANRGPAKFKKLTFREIAEESTAYLELKTGGADMLVNVPTDFLPRIQADKAVKLVTLPGNELVYMPINTSVEPFTDVKLREATAFAVNQKEILTSLYGGNGAAADTFLISSLKESQVEPKYKISYDPERSKKLFDAAGWKAGPDGIRVKDGKRLEVKLWTQNGTEFKRLVEIVQAQLKAVGMQADISIIDAGSINAQYRKKTEHQLAIRSYQWTNADIVDWFFAAKRAGYPNVSMFNDPEAERLNDIAMNKSKTWEERVANFTRYHEYVLSQYAFAPIYQPAQSLAYGKRIVLPQVIRGTGLYGPTMLDIAPAN
ncbi:peptide/nickel transport system substrate-binding protein [Bosea sp. BE125]|uniref:ABC transporter substrate-binding protein n=1 Tax=Bosea sp. BE125 TaxID=2817909 RepID=UPI00285C476F|nr:ABC transporter substrate-binding protein [Bosea sp. BE125]MDR6872090.1 peptide/nickel transport system substrate-binding protein [Bosea sp. BE125]